MTMTMTLTWEAATQLGVDESKVTPGLLGFLVVAALGAATYLLIRSMNRQLRRIDLPKDPPGEPEEADQDGKRGDGPGAEGAEPHRPVP